MGVFELIAARSRDTTELNTAENAEEHWSKIPKGGDLHILLYSTHSLTRHAILLPIRDITDDMPCSILCNQLYGR